MIAWLEVLPESGLGLPRDASAHGHLIDSALASTHWLDGLLVAALVAVLAIAAVRFRAPRRADPFRGDRAAPWVLGISLAIFLTVDGNLLWRTTRALDGTLWNFALPAGDPSTVRVEVNAHQWAWDVRYPGADGEFGTPDDVVRWNELRVPRGRKVWVQLAATDVIHAFNLPNFRVKIDAIPGHLSDAWFEPVREGEYEIACAQHCGVSHYQMRGVVTVMAPEAFDAWAREASEIARAADDPADAQSHWAWRWRPR